jgi:hypothetical protein
MKKFKLFLAIFAISTSMSALKGQSAGVACGCTGPTLTKAYTVPTMGTYEITYVSCPPAILLKDLKYTGRIGPPFLIQCGITCLLDDVSLTFTTIYFAGECARVKATPWVWGEGSGPRGVTGFNIEYCTTGTQCCSMDRILASGAFTGIPIDCDPGSPDDCIKICHPSP